jgi:hypothetical protein
MNYVLVQVEKQGSAARLRVRDVLMDMRRCRMGLVQTHDQLRFSYLAIIEGIKRIIRVPSLDSGFENNSEVRKALCRFRYYQMSVAQMLQV